MADKRERTEERGNERIGILELFQRMTASYSKHNWLKFFFEFQDFFFQTSDTKSFSPTFTPAVENLAHDYLVSKLETKMLR